MRIPRRLTITAALGVAALTAAAVPALAATSAPSVSRSALAGHVSTTIVNPDYSYSCSPGGEQWAVSTDNINIRSSPGGPAVAGIDKGRFFNSAFEVESVLSNCYAFTGSTEWIYGYENYNPSVSGWIAVNFLNPVAPLS